MKGLGKRIVTLNYKYFGKPFEHVWGCLGMFGDVLENQRVVPGRTAELTKTLILGVRYAHAHA